MRWCSHTMSDTTMSSAASRLLCAAAVRCGPQSVKHCGTSSHKQGPIDLTGMASTSVLVIGTGMIGAEVVRQLKEKGVQVYTADIQKGRGDFHIDLADISSITALDKALPNGVDHVSKFDSDSWTKNFESKLIPQSRLAVMLINNKEVHILKENGSVTITSGLAARTMNSNWPGISANCAGLDAFVRCAGVNTPRGLRLNAVAPTTVSETAAAAGQGTAGTVPKAVVCAMYVQSALGDESGIVYLGGDPGAPKAFNSKVFDFIHLSDKSKSKL